MTQNGLPGLIGILLGAVMLTAAGALAAYQEFEAFADGGISPAERFVALERGDYAAGPSLLAKRLLLESCAEAMRGLFGRMQAGVSQDSVARHCLAEADRIAAEAPSLGQAHLVGAMAAAALGDSVGFDRRLLAAQITAPAAQWLAEQRVPLAEDHYDILSERARARHADDLRLLVASQRGIASISGRYVRDPGFRERITAIVETMPDADQARFVARVRAAAEGAR